jgi:hypothetical protein
MKRRTIDTTWSDAFFAGLAPPAPRPEPIAPSKRKGASAKTTPRRTRRTTAAAGRRKATRP